MVEAKRAAEKPALDEVATVVRALAECMRDTGLSGLVVVADGVEIRLRSGHAPHVHEKTSEPVIERAAPPAPAARDDSASHLITSPMVGTFYLSAAPGQPAFVHPGDRVVSGQTIGIIEAMKIMNEISADRGGIVEEVLVANGQAVEYGFPLIRLSPDGGGG